MTSRGQEPTGSSPLRGIRVAVTRPETTADRLVALLESAGASTVVVPLVRIERPPDRGPLLEAAAAVDRYDWVVFTSANGVHFFGEALRQVGWIAGARPARGRVAAVGPATAEAVEHELGWQVAAVPDRFVGDEVAGAMAGVTPLEGIRVLWPKAMEARDVLRRDLVAAGALLDAPAAYATREDADAAVRLAGLLEAGRLDAVTLTSPSAARCLARARPPLERVVVAVIGPATADAARVAGLPVHVHPESHTIPGLVVALERHFAGS